MASQDGSQNQQLLYSMALFLSGNHGNDFMKKSECVSMEPFLSDALDSFIKV